MRKPVHEAGERAERLLFAQESACICSGGMVAMYGGSVG